MGTPRDSENTRAKIIAAAGRLFARSGFAGVTVRAIVKAADTHLSALNYHFRTKEALYREVLMEACREQSLSPQEQGQLLQLEPREALRVLIDAAIVEYRQQTTANWQATIMMRECWAPSAAFVEMAEAFFKPQTDFIAAIIGKIVAKPADDHQVRLAMVVLIGLLDTFGNYGRLIDAIAPGLSGRLSSGDLLAKQLTRIVVDTAKEFVEE